MMNVLVTGAQGFVGRNLCVSLDNIKKGKDKIFQLNKDISVFEYDIDTDSRLLDYYCAKADMVFNLAGVNRPKEQGEFMSNNFDFVVELLSMLKKHGNKCPVMQSSSTQAALDNPYGESKKAAENLFFEYARNTGTQVLVYRFPNVFGKWCRPNYNSVVATFCHNIAHGLPIVVNDPDTVLNLVYIDDVMDELLQALAGKPTRTGIYCSVPVTYTVKLGKIVDLIYSFKENRSNRSIANMSDEFTKKLYATYLSYSPADEFSYPLKMNIDARGSFTEIICTPERGQFSVNITKLGITKGNHWHHTKNEKFVVVQGMGLIRLRRIGSSEVLEYKVSGERMEVVDIPPGYTHSIENIGNEDLITFMWASECYNPEKPDTFYEEV